MNISSENISLCITLNQKNAPHNRSVDSITGQFGSGKIANYARLSREKVRNDFVFGVQLFSRNHRRVLAMRVLMQNFGIRMEENFIKNTQTFLTLTRKICF